MAGGRAGRPGADGGSDEIFNRVVSVANDVGLFSEEYDTKRKRLVGNFPQAFTHVAFLNAARKLSAARAAAGRVSLGRVRLGRVRLGRLSLGRVRLGRVRLGRLRLRRPSLGRLRVGWPSLGRLRLRRPRVGWPSLGLSSRSGSFFRGKGLFGRGSDFWSRPRAKLVCDRADCIYRAQICVVEGKFTTLRKPTAAPGELSISTKGKTALQASPTDRSGFGRTT